MKRPSPRLSHRSGSGSALDNPDHINTTFSTSCPHVLACLDLEAILRGPLFLPSDWRCSQCRKPHGYSVWACLSCREISCGAEGTDHRKAHFRRSKAQHALWMDVNERQVFCMLCEEYIADPPKSAGVIADLVDKLEKVRSGNYAVEGGEMVRIDGQPTPQKKSQQFETMDRFDTAYGHYKHTLVARVFRGWRVAASEESKRMRLAPDLNGPKKPPKLILEPTVSKVLLPGKTGLRNLGNTCFINSVIQCLSNVSPLRDWFIDQFMDTGTPIRYNDRVTLWRRGTVDCLQAMSSNVAVDQKEISMVVELHYILRVIWSGKWLVVTPYALLDALWKFVPHFRGYVQQDAQEFFQFLLDRINTELTETMRKIPKPFAVPVVRANAKPGAAAAAAAPAQSIVGEIFGGQFVSEVACGRCRNVSRCSEPFVGLELEMVVQSVARRRAGLPEGTTLLQCIESFSKWERIEDYRCDKCNRTVEAQKRIMISRLPRVLCIALKRFCITSAGTAAKNDAGVAFPLVDLSVRGCCSEEIAASAPLYALKALIVHHGLSMRKGHYTAICYNEELDGWWHYNDSKVTPVSEEGVMQSEAYMLFYEAENDFIRETSGC